MRDPHAALRDAVLDQVLAGPGQSDSSLRQAATDNTKVPADLQSLVAKVHAHAYKVTDADIEKLKATHSEDELFEIIVSAALGASRTRLLAGLDALAKTETKP